MAIYSRSECNMHTFNICDKYRNITKNDKLALQVEYANKTNIYICHALKRNQYTTCTASGVVNISAS